MDSRKIILKEGNVVTGKGDEMDSRKMILKEGNVVTGKEMRCTVGGLY